MANNTLVTRPGAGGNATGNEPYHPGHRSAMSLPAPVDEMLTKEELAARLKVAVRTLENWQHDGHIPFLKISNVILFYWPDVVEHLLKNYKVRR